jgi:hypothetical protein
MKILYCGACAAGSQSRWRTQALADLGFTIRVMDERPEEPGWIGLWRRAAHLLRQPTDPIRYNRGILSTAKEMRPDLVWIDKGLCVRPTTLASLRKLSPQIRIIGFSNDPMIRYQRINRWYIKGIPQYDLIVTPRGEDIQPHYALGARRVLLIQRSYNARIHRVYDRADIVRKGLGGDLGFIGRWEPNRAAAIRYAAEAGLKIRIWPWGRWRSPAVPGVTVEQGPLWDEDYGVALNSFKINLCFLSKWAHDNSTSRSFEIPACRGFMLAERTEEHLALFRDGREAVYFATAEELVEKAYRYLADEKARARIAQAGRDRLLDVGIPMDKQIAVILEAIGL